MTRKIAIVGGGYAGFEIAKELDAFADVTLIEPRAAFVHAPAAIRALVQPALLEQIILPYDKLLKSGTWEKGRAVTIAADHVMLEGGRRIDADFIVVATGSSYSAPFKPAGDDIAAFRAAQHRVTADLEVAKTVVIAGAGPVGIELAGEIAAAQPNKQVTLVASDARLMPGYPAALGQKLAHKLSALGVDVRLGVRAEDIKTDKGPYKGTLRLSNGDRLEADLVFPAIGARAVPSPLADLPDVRQAAAGRIEVDKWMRPSSSLANVFVAGDAASAGDAMTIVATARQNPWLIKTLKALIKGGKVEQQKPYRPWKKAPILLPLGPEQGNSWLFMTLGNTVTSKMKGKDLFLPKYKKSFGLA